MLKPKLTALAQKYLNQIEEASKTPIMLPLDSLHLTDSLYHKHLNEKKMLRICENFKPEKFKPILVGKRKSGDYYVIDGQHRFVVAAVLEHKEILCCVVDTTCDLHEMDMYLAFNQ